MLIQEVCNKLGVVIVAIECDKDHVHLFLNTLPTLSPADTMAKIKGVTSKKSRDEFLHFQHLPSLWARSYFVSTAGHVSSETIKHYIENQKMRGKLVTQSMTIKVKLLPTKK